MSDQELRRLFEDVGFIKGKLAGVASLEKRVDEGFKSVGAQIKEVHGKVDGIQLQLARVKGWASGAGAVFGLISALVVAGIKKMVSPQ